MTDIDPGALTRAELVEPPRVTVRRLPALVVGAVRLATAAAPREFLLMLALQAISGLGLIVPILAGRDLLAKLLQLRGSDPLLPLILQAAVVVALLGAMSLASTVATGRDDILSELFSRYATRRILDVACTAELEQFERPAFHNRLERATASAAARPYQLAQGLGSLLQGLLATVGVSVALAAIEPLLVLITVLTVVPLWIAGVRSGHILFAMNFRLTPAERERDYLFDLLTGRGPAKEVRAYGLAGHLRERWERRTAERLSEVRAMVANRLRITLVARCLSGIVLGIALGALAALALAGRMTVADTGAAVGAMLLLSVRLRFAAMGTDLLFEAAPFVDDLRSFLATAQARPTLPPPVSTGFQHLTVEDLTFAYPSSAAPVLRGVNLDIRAGEVVALVGENGSGKTTLAKVLCHLYRPQSGRIRYDGVDVTAADPQALRGTIAMLFQDYQRYLLSATDNIRLGRWDRGDDHLSIVDAATTAGAHAFLAGLPHGYRTLLGPEFDGGTELSGGQWQRMALARAFFRDAPFVILDEPTAALDARAEHELFQRVRELLTGRTVLLISHRFSAVRSADRIYVLSAGRVVEQGTHADLMALGGRYAELFTLQASRYVDHPAPRGR